MALPRLLRMLRICAFLEASRVAPSPGDNLYYLETFFVVPTGGEEGWVEPGVLVNILQRTGRPPTIENYLAPSASTRLRICRSVLGCTHSLDVKSEA